ncbi:condensation domain-containing protein [Bosea sp. (in: a-proteobacteria)]|uniref:condensation domain-containing protein n=1 Tax=Bosea sp. (in: a-proteobacteria) TaxID=1871050 RepID=UPI002635035C|nr:condensation domain-containing protein [Bosea sp. (in: a-proteobacteria)]MCO5090979.1 condensation domain-containing protein [Bosea sp. (in: a-proteobacteria)]
MPNHFTREPEVPVHTPERIVMTARCSSVQERYWRLDRLDPGTPALNIVVKWRIRGHLDASLAQDAFQAILDRHESLRTSIREEDGRPVQAIAEDIPFKLPEIDLSGLAEADRAIEADRIAQIEARTSFALGEAPLLRATLLRQSRAEAVILVIAHHIVSDGWSMGIIAKDFVAAYQALGRGRKPALRDLPLQYSDFAEGSRDGLAGGEFAREEAYWRRQLAELPDTVVPPDRPRPALRSASGASLARLLPRPLTAGLTELARGEGTTFFCAAYAVLLELLHQRTGACDIALGTQMAARDDAELETIVGPFVNTVVLRTAVTDDLSFGALCRAARDTFEDAVDHHLWPFDRVLSMLPTRGDASRPPLSINFIVQRAFIGELANDSFQLSGIPSPLPGALYDLNFILVEREEGWRLTCEYHRDLYDEATASGLVAQYESIAEAVLADPAAPLSQALPVASIQAPAIGAAGLRRTWLQKAGTQPTLFALNHTAHNLRLYRPLSQGLGPDQPFVALQLIEPTVDGAAPASIEQLAAAYCDAIVATGTDGGYRLAGFCRSGVIAYEAARQLAAAGHEVDLLVLIDCWAPGYFLRQPYRARLLFRLRRAGRFARRLWRGGPRNFATRMGFWLQSTAAIRQVKRLFFWRVAEEAADEADFWRTTDELEALVQRYVLPDYDGRVLLFRSEAIPEGWPPDPALGWTGHLAADTPRFAIRGEGHEGAFSEAGSQSMALRIIEAVQA